MNQELEENAVDTAKKRENEQVDNPDQPTAKKPKRLTKKELRKRDPALFEFRREIQQCCKENDLKKAMESYDKAIVANTKIEGQTFYNLLNLCDGLRGGLHIGSSKPTDKKTAENNDSPSENVGMPEDVYSTDTETRIQYAEKIKKRMDELKIPLTENAYFALIKLYSRTNQTLSRASDLLAQAEAVPQCKPKLRLYAPLLAKYCANGELLSALEVWRKLADQKLIPSEKEYHALIRCSTMQPGGSRVVVPVMERVLADLAEDILVPSKDTCQAICEWFQSPHAIQKDGVTSSDNREKDAEIEQLLGSIHFPYPEQAASMGPVQSADGSTWEISRDIRINQTTGELLDGCLKGSSLLPVALSDNSWEIMQKMNGTIASSGKLEEHKSDFQGGRKGPIRNMLNKEKRQAHWKWFEGYLDKRFAQRKIDVVIDGANVGYYGKSAGGGRPKHVDYQQIDWVIEHFRKQGKSVLMVIHSRHFARNFMPRQFAPLLQRWIDEDVIYRTPPGMNDDWFWMHAALKAGAGTLVVTNDEMRDHHFQMLAPRYFLRWKDRSQVHFYFGDEKSESDRRQKRSPTVEFTPPERYSRRIQRVLNGLVIPLPKKGDDQRFLDGTFVAEEDGVPEDETYLCIRPRSI